MYIYTNLFLQNSQTLNSQKTLSVSDAEAKYERIVIASLHGYTLYLNKVKLEAISKSQDLNQKIISNAMFWKISKSKVASIRAAWFGVITALCQKASFLLVNDVAHVAVSVFSNLDESEPSVMPFVWEAALLSATTLTVSSHFNNQIFKGPEKFCYN